MKVSSILALVGVASAVNTRGSRKAALERKGIQLPHRSGSVKREAPLVRRGTNGTIIPQTEKTESEFF